MSVLFLDLGSHSAKVYRQGERFEVLDTVTWTLLESADSATTAEHVLQALVSKFYSGSSRALAVGTEAMRRNPELAEKMSVICRNLGISYETLSHENEAELIRRAVSTSVGMDIINVGGGSIQIVSGSSASSVLLRFGISELNQRFSLKAVPQFRKIEECIRWVSSQLPEDLSQFIYTGGEATYLRHLGVPLREGLCLAKDFSLMADRLASLPTKDLESLSPHDPKWMSGAIASNCIVLACLQKSGSESFVASDLNIAHGLAQEFISIAGG